MAKCAACAKAREGTAVVKSRKREGMASADRVSTTTGAVNQANTRYTEYLRALKQHQQGK